MTSEQTGFAPWIATEIGLLLAFAKTNGFQTTLLF